MSAPAASGYLSEAAYARHRGVSRQSVSEYKQRGQLVMAGELVDVVASDALLLGSQNPVVGGDRSKSAVTEDESRGLFAAKTREAQARAVERELKVRRQAGELVDRESVSKAVFASARAAQESLMAIADRLSPGLAVETDASEIHKMLTDELRAVCQQIATDAKVME